VTADFNLSLLIADTIAWRFLMHFEPLFCKAVVVPRSGFSFFSPVPEDVMGFSGGMYPDDPLGADSSILS